MDETHVLVTQANRKKLFLEWACYWNMSRHVLMEKSPRHTVMTRFLQEMFGPGRTRFVLMMRHPLGTLHNEMVKNMTNVIGSGCGDYILDHWLHVHEILAYDVAFLQHVVFVMFEHFMGVDSQAIFDALQTQVGLAPHVKVPKTAAFDDRTYNMYKWSQPKTGARRLLELHGDRKNLTVIADSEFLWIDSFTKYHAQNKEQCDAMISKYEERVNVFGYSLRSPRGFWKPPPFEAVYVKGFDASFPVQRQPFESDGGRGSGDGAG